MSRKDVETGLVDLRNISLADLATRTEDELGNSVDRLRIMIDMPTLSLSGYNGASGLSGDVTIDPTIRDV